MKKVSITIDGTLERIPEDEQEFKAWCEKHGVDYLGETGRRGWWSDESTYIRGAEYLFISDCGAGCFLLYENDFTITSGAEPEVSDGDSDDYSQWNEEAEIMRRAENPEISGNEYPPDPYDDDPY